MELPHLDTFKHTFWQNYPPYRWPNMSKACLPSPWPLPKQETSLFSREMRALSNNDTLFVPGTAFWRVNRELLLNLAGSSALLMELAHPLVAAGVAENSHFRRHPLARLYRTGRSMADMTFGTVQSALQAARHINNCHRRVRGVLQEGTGRFLPLFLTAKDPLQPKIRI